MWLLLGAGLIELGNGRVAGGPHCTSTIVYVQGVLNSRRLYPTYSFDLFDSLLLLTFIRRRMNRKVEWWKSRTK